MNVSTNWKVRNNATLEEVVTSSDSTTRTDNSSFITLDKDTCSDSCEITFSFTNYYILNSIDLIVSSRICEVYAVETGKTKPTYLSTIRCGLLDETINVDGVSTHLYNGTYNSGESLRCSSIKIRCLSIKEKTRLSIRSIQCNGTSSAQKVATSNSVVDENPNRLYVPSPIKPEDSLSSALQTSFAQQVLFEGKMKSLEERFNIVLERRIAALTESYKKENNELKERLNIMEEKVKELELEVTQLKDTKAI